ncbi:MAG: S-layer homology domain-containing protein [Lachnospirales bacterium]
MLKKIFAGALAAVMTFAIPMVSFGQETIDIDCVVDNSTVNVGDVFYADFKINSNPVGYNVMQCFVDFDSSKLQALECEVEDIPSDLIIYRDSSNVAHSMFPYSMINERVNFVPSSGDVDYLGKADGKKTAGEIGRLKIAGLLNIVEDGNSRVNYTGTGTVLRMKFKAIGAGTSEIAMNDVIGKYSYAQTIDDLNFNVNNGSVTIAGNGGNSEATTETTTAQVTETTTKAPNSSSSGGSGGGSSSSATATATTTTTEATTELTTSADVIGGNDASTDISVVSFKDVENDFWGHDAIIGLATKGIVNGYPDGTFKPNDNVKRADFLIMLLKGLGVDISVNNTTANFTDVEANAYYANACAIAKEMGIATGNPDGSFAPNSFITRQDMMILTKKALESKLGTTLNGDISVLDKFNDKADISTYAVDSLAAMVENNIVNGMGNGIAPKANTTRAQSAAIISKVINFNK